MDYLVDYEYFSLSWWCTVFELYIVKLANEPLTISTRIKDRCADSGFRAWEWRYDPPPPLPYTILSLVLYVKCTSNSWLYINISFIWKSKNYWTGLYLTPLWMLSSFVANSLCIGEFLSKHWQFQNLLLMWKVSLGIASNVNPPRRMNC